MSRGEIELRTCIEDFYFADLGLKYNYFWKDYVSIQATKKPIFAEIATKTSFEEEFKMLNYKILLYK